MLLVLDLIGFGVIVAALTYGMLFRLRVRSMRQMDE